MYVYSEMFSVNRWAELTQSTDLDDTFQLGVQNYLSYYRQLILNGLMESLRLDIYGQAVVQLVLDNSQDHVIRHLEQERASVRDVERLGTVQEGGAADTGDLEPLECDPAASAIIENHLNDFTYHSEHVGPSSQQPQFQGIGHYQVQEPLEQPLQEDYLNVDQPIMAATETGFHPPPLQDHTGTSKEIDRTILTAWGEYIFQS
jgi:hypothetical protein